MQILQTSTLSKKKYTFQILDSIETQLEVTENPYNLAVEDLFIMAARINKKRSFLFVSKVLGKHLPIDPNKGLSVAVLLAARYAESVIGLQCQEKESLVSSFLKDEPFTGNSFIPPEINPLVIGFAETATALGHAFFDCFESAAYFHTTREEMYEENPIITFEEEHSHATSHRSYIPKELIQNNREIILVDDEMTTGKTALNIIQSIHAQFPRKVYTVVSILDWRSDEHKEQFKQLEKSLGITINTVSLLAGKVQVKQLLDLPEKRAENGSIEKRESSLEFIHMESFFTKSTFMNMQDRVFYIEESGRFGISSTFKESIHKRISEAAAFLRQKRSGEKTLCLGTGEFMYVPMKLAAEMGEGVSYQSTTRSPIYIENKQGYGARYGLSFPSPEDPGVANFVYNIPPGLYDEVFVFFERQVEVENLHPFINELEKLQMKSIKLVFFSGKRGEQHV